MTMRVLAALALATVLAAPAIAVQPDEVLPDPRLETRARTISEGLRCLVCQNQSIDDSDAPLARDLRLLVRDRLKAGDSDADVEKYVVQRYGEFVLLRPVVAPHTMLLWFGPALVLTAGILGLAFTRRRGADPALPLSPAEQARLHALAGREEA
jgi:cytochrome c-type biogenesis protein CcmH